MPVGFLVWIVTTQCVNLAFYLVVTQGVRGWRATAAVYVGAYLAPLAGCLLWADPLLHGDVQGASGSIASGFLLFFAIWGAVTLAMSRGALGRRLFAVFVCGVHQVGAFVFSLLVLHVVGPRPLGDALASGVMAAMGLFLVRSGIPKVRKMDAVAGWKELNLTAAMNFALLFATGFWPVYVPTGSAKDVAVFVVANVVAIVYFPVCHAFAEKNRVERALRRVEGSTRVLLAELKSARAAEEGARRVRHDTRHHVSVVRGMLAAGRVKESDEYLANMCRHELLSSLGSRHWCANPLVDALLAVADRKAAACGKTLSATADVAEELPFDEVDIVALLGNVLENAIRHGVGDAVSASVTLEHGIFRLTVANAVGPGFTLANGLPSPEEGVGLMSVRQVVDRHHGLIGYEVRGDELLCKVMVGSV